MKSTLVEHPLRSVRSTLLCWLRQLCIGAARLSSASSACFALCIAASLLSSCSWMHEDIALSSDYDDAPIRLYSRAAESTSMNARLFLWHQADYIKFLGDDAGLKDVNSFFDVGMTNPIDAYRFYTSGEGANKENFGTPYNTYENWPETETSPGVYDYPLLYASGVAPDVAYDWSNSTHSSIVISDGYKDGLTEILASINDGKSRGKKDEPFVKKDGTVDEIESYNEERELKFYHPTAAITFKGKRSPNMTQRIGVRDVTIEINNNANGVSKLAVPTSLTRYVGTSTNSVLAENKAWTYIVDDVSTLKPNMLTATFNSHLLMDLTGKDPAQEMVTFYVLSDGITYGSESGNFDPFVRKMGDNNKQPVLSVNIDAYYYLTDDETETRHIRWENVAIHDWSVADDADPTGNQFMPSHKYEVTITFDSKSVALRAELVPWVEEGPYYYPVWGTTSDALYMEVFNASGTESLYKTRMNTPCGSFYTAIAELEAGQQVEFYHYANGEREVYTFSSNQPDTNYYDFEGDIQNTNSNTDGRIVVKESAAAGKYNIRFDIGQKKITATPYTPATSDGYYFSSDQLVEGPYDDCYGTQDFVFLTPGSEYHLSNLKDGIETFLSLSGFNYDENHFTYSPSKLGLVFKDKATEGWYHIVYDEKTKNIASMLIATDKSGNTYTGIERGVYLGPDKLNPANDSPTTHYQNDDATTKIIIHDTDDIFKNGIVSLTQISENSGTPEIKVSMFKSGTDGQGLEYGWTVDATDLLDVDEDGSCRFLGKKSTYKYRFTIDLGHNKLSCVYLNPNDINKYRLNGDVYDDGNNITTVVSMAHGQSVPMKLVSVGENYATTAISLTGWTINPAGLMTIDADGMGLTLANTAEEGYYKLVLNNTNRTITAMKVRDEAGNPIVENYRINGNDVSNTSNHTETYYFTESNNVNCTIVRIAEDDSEETINIKELSYPGNITAENGKLVLRSGMPAGWYKLEFNLNTSPITISSTRVANSYGDPILATPQYYNGNNTVGSTVTAIVNIDQDYGTATYDLGGFKKTDNRCDQNGNIIYTDIDFTGAPITAPSGCDASITGSRSTFMLSFTGAAGKYKISINLATPAITIEEATIYGILWTGEVTMVDGDRNSIMLAYDNDVMARLSQVNAGDKFVITITNANQQGKIKFFYDNRSGSDGSWVWLTENDFNAGTTSYTYQITSDKVDNIRTGGIIITGSGNYNITQVTLEKSN